MEPTSNELNGAVNWLLFSDLGVKCKVDFMETSIPYSQPWSWALGEIQGIVCVIGIPLARTNWDLLVTELVTGC